MTTPRLWAFARAIAIAAPLVILPSSCGPAAIAWGITELADDDPNTVFVLIFINNNGERVELNLAGALQDGSPFAMDGVVLQPAGATTVTVPQLAAVRVRGCEMLAASATRAPVTWDYDIQSPGERATSTLGVESVVVGELRNVSPEQVQIQRLDSDAAQTAFQFTPLAQTDLPIVPDRVVLHPSGGYAYLLRDLGSNMAEIQAFRVDAETKVLEFIGNEFGTTPENPTGFAYTTSFADTELVIDPLGRFAYVLDNDQANSRCNVRLFRVDADGTLRQNGGFVRSFISSLVFRPDGRFVYLHEDTDASGTSPGDGTLRAIEIDPENGSFALETGQASVGCGQTLFPDLAIHPSARFAFIAEQEGATNVIVHSYSLGATITLLETKCAGELQQIDDLSFDPAGLFLYITGKNTVNEERVIRFPIDQATGILGARDDTQGLGNAGDLSNITSGADPNLAATNQFKNIIYVAIDDRLVPHSRNATTGELTVVPGAPELPFGDTTSTRLVTESRSGTVQIQGQ